MKCNFSFSNKSCLLIFFLLINSEIGWAQEGENPLPYAEKESAYDTAPQYPGGAAALNDYFDKTIQYPEPEKSQGIEGDVALKFEVTKKGKITNVSPINGVPGGPNLVREAIRVVLLMPEWVPATKKGKRVQAAYQLHVPFKINGAEIK